MGRVEIRDIGGKRKEFSDQKLQVVEAAAKVKSSADELIAATNDAVEAVARKQRHSDEFQMYLGASIASLRCTA